MATVAELMVSISARSDGLKKELTASKRQLSRFQKDMPDLIPAGAGTAFAALGVAMGAAALKSVSLSAAMEQNKIAFTTMLGSGQAAQKMLEDLATFAEKTPFDFTSLVTSSKKMIGLGFSAQEIIPTLNVLGDAVAAVGGNSEQMASVVDALAKMRAGGALAADQMNRLTDAGIPAWQMLAKVLNTDVATAMSMAEKKSIDASTAISGMMTEMKTRYNGTMKSASNTVSGQLSNIQDTAISTMTVVGEQITQAFDLKDKLGAASAEFAKFADNVKSHGIGQTMADMIPDGAIIASMTAITAYSAARFVPAMAAVRNVMLEARIAALAFNTALGPIGWAITGTVLTLGTFGMALKDARGDLDALPLEDASMGMIDFGNSTNYAADALKRLNTMGDFRRSEDTNTMPSIAPAAPVAPGPGGGSGGSSGVDEVAKAWDDLLDKAKQTTQSIEQEWINLTKSELEQTDIWKAEQLTALEESKDANANYDRDVTRVNEMYSKKRVDIAQREAADIIRARERINDVRQDVAQYGNSSVLQDIENERQARIKAINDTTMAQVDKSKLIDQVNEQSWKKFEQYELSGNALYDALHKARYEGDFVAYTQLLDDKNAAFLSSLEAQETMFDLYRQIQMDKNTTWSEAMADISSSAYGGLVDALGDIISGAESASNAFKAMGSAVTSTIANIAAKIIAANIATAIFGEQTANKQTTSDVKAGATTAAAWWPAAIARSLATAGGNAVPAIAGMAAASAAGIAMGAIAGKATGGPITGPGTGTSDNILTWLSNGEYVIKASAARLLGMDTLNTLNTGRLPGFSGGGGMTTGPSLSSLSTNYSSAAMTKNMSFEKASSTASQQPPQNNYHVSVQAWDGKSVDQWFRNGGTKKIMRELRDAHRSFAFNE